MKERIMEIALKRSFLIPSNEIYGHVAGFYDYGPVGAPMKRKIEDAWRKHFIFRDGLREVQTTTILPEIVLKASGHATHFGDPLVKCKKCGEEHRADSLIYDATGEKCEGKTPDELNRIIKEKEIKCPGCGGELEPVGWFNLMFMTNVGPVEGNTAYLRPETAQGIFLDFMRSFRASGAKLPIGLGQVGRSFRNEIAPRKGLMRLREFTQMEIEYFFDPDLPVHPKFGEVEDYAMPIITRDMQENGKEEPEVIKARDAVRKGVVVNQIVAYYMVRVMEFYESLGVPKEKMRYRHMLPEETPHYSEGNYDLEVHTSYGWVETVGIAYRTDYDLKNHSRWSGEKLSVFIEGKGRVIPHVVEPSMGVDRLFWCILEHCYREGGGAEGRDWEWFDFPPHIAPFQCAVFPLMKKDGLKEKAADVAKLLRDDGMEVVYDETGSIGKRYARQDEIGTPYCVTVDYQTLEDDTVTIRFRNDGKQIREKIEGLSKKLKDMINEGRVRL